MADLDALIARMDGTGPEWPEPTLAAANRAGWTCTDDAPDNRARCWVGLIGAGTATGQLAGSDFDSRFDSEVFRRRTGTS